MIPEAEYTSLQKLEQRKTPTIDDMASRLGYSQADFEYFVRSGHSTHIPHFRANSRSSPASGMNEEELTSTLAGGKVLDAEGEEEEEETDSVEERDTVLIPLIILRLAFQKIESLIRLRKVEVPSQLQLGRQCLKSPVIEIAWVLKDIDQEIVELDRRAMYLLDELV